MGAFMIFNESLKKNADFQKVYKEHNSRANRLLVLYVRANDLGRNRLGISVSRKVGNSVVRHHLTRLVREAYRLHEASFQIGWDMVVVARKQAGDADFHQMESAFLHIARLQKLITEADQV